MLIFILSYLFFIETTCGGIIPEPVDRWGYPSDTYSIHDLAWSGDGAFLAIAEGEFRWGVEPGRIHIYESQTGVFRLLVADFNTPDRLVWRDSDNALFSTHSSGDRARRFFYGWDSQTGESVGYAPEGGSAYDLTFNPVDGRLAVSYGRVLKIFDAALRVSMEDSLYRIDPDVWSSWVETDITMWLADGEQIVTMGHPDAPESLSAWVLETAEIVSIFAESDSLMPYGLLTIALSPDGEWLAATSGRPSRWGHEQPVGDLLIWSTADGALHHRIENTSRGIHALAWSPDSRLLASANLDGELLFWDVATGHIHDEWQVGAGTLAWSSDNLLALTHCRELLIFDMSEDMDEID